MHSRRSQGHWIGARMSGEWGGLFHTPSIPNLGAQRYSLNMVKPERSMWRCRYTFFLECDKVLRTSRPLLCTGR